MPNIYYLPGDPMNNGQQTIIALAMQGMQRQEMTHTHTTITRIQQDVCHISQLAWEPCLSTYYVPADKLELERR